MAWKVSLHGVETLWLLRFSLCCPMNFPLVGMGQTFILWRAAVVAATALLGLSVPLSCLCGLLVPIELVPKLVCFLEALQALGGYSEELIIIMS